LFIDLFKMYYIVVFLDLQKYNYFSYKRAINKKVYPSNKTFSSISIQLNAKLKMQNGRETYIIMLIHLL